MGAQYQERFREPRQGEDDADSDDAPPHPIQSAQVGEPDRWSAPAAFPLTFPAPRSLLDTGDNADDRQQRRHHRDPEHQPKVVVESGHRSDRQQRSGEGAGGVHRLAQAVGAPADSGRCDVGDQRVSRCAAQALADAIGETGEEDETRSHALPR